MLACSILPGRETQEPQPQSTALSHVTPPPPPGRFQDKAPSREKWKAQETILGGKIAESEMKTSLQRKASLVTHVPENIPCRAGSRSCQKARKLNPPQATLGPVGPQVGSCALATNAQQRWRDIGILGVLT